jgi:4-amino-4-deoxy-L-arabinose transferase-like glycosyltransferase
LDNIDIPVAIGLAVVSGAIIGSGLGVQSLANWDEAIYGVVTRELLARPGLTLYYGADPWFEKPPLLFWLMATSTAIFGVTEFALRLPTAIFGVGAVVLQYFAGRRLGGRMAGVMAAALLLGVPQFVAYSRLAMTDVPLAALGMLATVMILYGEHRPSLTVAAGVAFGLAVLTKSVAAFLFLPGLLAIVIARRGLRSLLSKDILLATALALAVAAPWHVWSAITYGRSFIDPYFLFHVIDRFLGPLEEHSGGPFYYVHAYSMNAGWLALIHAAGLGVGLGLAFLQRDRLLAAIVFLPLAAFIIIDVQATKIGWYLTPVYPGAALAVALSTARLLSRAGARVGAAALATVLAVPGIIHGRGIFIEQYGILDSSPEVRALRNAQPFAKARVPALYTVSVSDPAPRFYLADHVQSINATELERLLAGYRPFLCLTIKATAIEFLNRYRRSGAEIVASTESLAVIERRARSVEAATACCLYVTR